MNGLKALARDAERHRVTIVLEHLNSRVTGHDSKGHPGYQGDDIDYCADIIRQVGSPRVKLLFDIYHVQVMHGDVIARIRQYGSDLIGHVHTAGVPGRGELDDTQELQYAPVMKALLEVGYAGLRRAGVHPDPERDGGAAAGGHDLRRVGVTCPFSRAGWQVAGFYRRGQQSAMATGRQGDLLPQARHADGRRGRRAEFGV